MSEKTIVFDSHIPYYHQLLEIIKQKVEEGIWLPGDQIPSEMELCKTFGVSRTVVRQALRELQSENIIIKRKGKGTFISKPKISEGFVQKLTGFYHDMLERGLEPKTKVLYQEIVPANKNIADNLNVSVGIEVVEIERLRYIHDEPIQLVTTYIPLYLSPKLATTDLSHRSLYEFLKTEYDIMLFRGIRHIEAVLAKQREADLLEIEKGDPLLLLDSISYSKTGQVIEYYHALHRGDRSRFEVELVHFDENNLA